MNETMTSNKTNSERKKEIMKAQLNPSFKQKAGIKAQLSSFKIKSEKQKKK